MGQVQNLVKSCTYHQLISETRGFVRLRKQIWRTHMHKLTLNGTFLEDPTTATDFDIYIYICPGQWSNILQADGKRLSQVMGQVGSSPRLQKNITSSERRFYMGSTPKFKSLTCHQHQCCDNDGFAEQSFWASAMACPIGCPDARHVRVDDLLGLWVASCVAKLL